MDLFDKFYLWNRKTYKIGNNTAIHFMHKFSTVYKMPENWPIKPKWQAASVCHSLLKSVTLHKYLLMEKSDKIIALRSGLDSKFLSDIIEIILHGRDVAYKAVNESMLRTYWAVGKRIVEEEQHGELRAKFEMDALPKSYYSR